MGSGPQDVSLNANVGAEDEVECPLRPDGLNRKAAAQPSGYRKLSPVWEGRPAYPPT